MLNMIFGICACTFDCLLSGLNQQWRNHPQPWPLLILPSTINYQCCIRCSSLLFEALMKLVQLQWKSLINKNLPSLMVYVHKNQCQLFHMSNGIIWLTNWITLVHLNSFRPINLFLHLICVSFKNTLYIKNTLSGVLAVSWGPEIFI